MEFLLPIHIIAGTIALFCAAMSVLSEKGKKVHVLSGRTYFWGMATIFLTAIPMSIISSNIFLFLIAIFSFYLAFAGMRFARNRKGVATILDWIAICLMIFSGIGMWILAGAVPEGGAAAATLLAGGRAGHACTCSGEWRAGRVGLGQLFDACQDGEHWHVLQVA